MVHPFLGVPCCLALSLAPVLSARAEDSAAYAARLATAETILERFYRGESLSAGQKRLNAQVDGVAVPASEVGIDGLLGQSFLKHFAYTIDPGQPGKLVLVRRD
jgi:hypothetical protein